MSTGTEDLLPPGSEITVDNCAREPIRTPGGIQPHGAVLVLSGHDREIVQHSENAAEKLGRRTELLGATLNDVLGATAADQLAIPSTDIDTAGLRPHRITLGEQRFDAFSYPAGDGLTVVELESAGPAATAEALADDVAGLLSALQSADSILGLLQAAARWARQLSGFDRVWIYRFEADDHGVVIVEERPAATEPFLGLHFPARDIPPQARALFLQNRVRFIPDSSAIASALVPLINPISGDWLDLSGGILRAVSPMHLQYLQNMGVVASFSIALEVDGRLWGLISGHHYAEPRVVEHRIRLACEVLGRVVSSRLSSLLTEQHAHARLTAERHREEILAAIALATSGDDAGAEELTGSLAGVSQALLDLCGADGAAVVSGQAVEVFGQAPPADVVRGLALAVRPGTASDQTVARLDSGVLVTSSLAEGLPEFAEAAMPSCGMIGLPLDREGTSVLLWFRDEYAHSITWGDSGLAPAKGRLSPTGSYATWSESVTRSSRPWAGVDLEAVLSLRAGIGTLVLEQAEELRRANLELQRSNADLDAFTFVIAHDLREPLRNMQSFLSFFREDHGADLNPEGNEQLDTIARLGVAMDAMMDSLLDHARADRLRPKLVELSLQDLVDATRLLLGPYSSRGDIEVLTPQARIIVDRDAMLHVLANLLTNAMKYSPGDRPRVQVDVRGIDQTERGGDPERVAVAVRDFGIGVPAEYHETIFALFRRLHARDAFHGGSGAGLAIARRLAERQGGDVWLDASEPGQGSLFCVSVLPARQT